MNPKTALIASLMLALISAPAWADEVLPWDPEQEVAPVLDTTNLEDEDLPPPAAEQAPESAHVITPDLADGDDGIVRVVRDGDSYANITRSDKLIERIALVSSDSGCKNGVGQVGTVEFCDGGTKLTLMGRPTFSCPSLSTNTYGPCKATPEEE